MPCTRYIEVFPKQVMDWQHACIRECDGASASHAWARTYSILWTSECELDVMHDWVRDQYHAKLSMSSWSQHIQYVVDGVNEQTLDRGYARANTNSKSFDAGLMPCTDEYRLVPCNSERKVDAMRMSNYCVDAVHKRVWDRYNAQDMLTDRWYAPRVLSSWSRKSECDIDDMHQRVWCWWHAWAK